MMFDRNRRLGKIKISNHMMEKEPQLMANIVMRDCIVLSANYLLHEENMEYVIYSPEFDVLDESDVIPEYHCECGDKYDLDGTQIQTTRTWQRIR